MAIPATPATAVKKSFQFGGQTVTLETGAIARQARSVIVSMRETVVMVNVVARTQLLLRPNLDSDGARCLLATGERHEQPELVDACEALAALRRLEFLDSRDVELLLARGGHDPCQFLAVASASISSLNPLS